MYTLRPYQQDCVKATVHYFRKHSSPAVLALPTGAGKSLVIAELARIARGRVLVLTHVKELVEQNHAKYESYGLNASIFSAGLGRKETDQQVVFASVQSMVNSLEQFNDEFSLLVIDECHRVPDDENSAYQRVIQHLQRINAGIKILGLTATPYRLGMGWIYKYHTRGQVRTEQDRFFRDCIFELPIRYLLDEGFLTEPSIMDMAVIGYDFSSLKPANNGHYKEADLDAVIAKSSRATPVIIDQVIDYAKDRKGVMIFASTVNHAKEIMGYLAGESAALVVGDTPLEERDRIITGFKNQQIKYLVNVSVLTTGFDAPHVDLIAILRPTESISLYQQIVGRGLRLAEGKSDCLVLEYAGNCYDLYQPEVGDPKPDSNSEVIMVPCPACGFKNSFWGKLDPAGFLIEHYGRRCQGYFEDDDGEREECGYRFRAKFCEECGTDNDIAARRCHQCDAVMVDPDKKLRDALKLKDAMIMKCTDMKLEPGKNQYGKPQLKVTYFSEEDGHISEVWTLANKTQKSDFLKKFINPHLVDRHRPFTDTAPTRVASNEHRLRPPEIIIARKSGRFWAIRDKLFDLDQYKQ
ncbi:DEAD/DEAH box helicase [Photobacterium sp. WH77]|uniref:DEAD/DEAH box helicase n=1 Tax=unclassified Photobacterium TaxID=2628852 RepID=UPI001ED9E172|nr:MULTISPECIES: DEAD/DEAH box helicase [unclassified Photobacterium]MCG2836319.1 DEAD/DEAH box helicase [Photobacterium sp. WH77]MCG2844054.1 DEAD/DEAH box helicase [Photobacterium sp. WH80]